MRARAREAMHGLGESKAPWQSFPATHTSVLAEAAAGNWDRFLELYLEPCWREVVLACRCRGVPVSDTPDVFQELALRLLKRGKFKPGDEADGNPAQPGARFQANLPGRFLKYRELHSDSARFRTFLKKVIKFVVLEQVRAQCRRPVLAGTEGIEGLEPWIEESISGSLDRRWVAGCLLEAARQLRLESEAARTRGRRRLFLVLYLSIVKGHSAAAIGERFGLDRTTVAGLLTRARRRFVQILHDISGIQDRAELKNLVKEVAEELADAFATAYGER